MALMAPSIVMTCYTLYIRMLELELTKAYIRYKLDTLTAAYVYCPRPQALPLN